MFQSGLFTYKSGDRVTCTIKGNLIKDALIHIINSGDSDFEYEISTTRAFICHNDPECAGSSSPVMYGYRYSWAFHMNQDGRLTDDVRDLRPEINGIERKEKYHMDIEIQHFLNFNQLENLFPLFRYKFGIFDEFESYEVGEGDGCIKLKNDRKSVEIKLSRFVRQMALKLNEFAATHKYISKLDVSDKFIEMIHNKFVSYQKDSSQMINFLSGEDILKGYTRANYLDKDGGTLHKSCMVDRHDYLKIYTQNPNQVELAVVYIEDKIAARCFVWTATDGKKYSDRVYFRHDWLENLMKEKLRKVGILPISEETFKSVQLEKWEFEYYPYADNFYFLDRKNGTLLSIQTDRFSQLRNTNGRIA